MALTDIKIKSLKPLEKKYKIYDRDGLYLLICPNGSKYFRYNFKFKKKSKTYAIGVYPNTSLQEAREILVEVKKMLSNGINPNDNKKNIQKTHSNNSFYEISLEWKELLKNKITEKHAKDKWQKLEKNIFPYIADKNIKEITSIELLQAIRIIENRGAIETARRVKSIVGEIYSYAIATGRAERNIANDLNGALKSKPPVKHTATITDTKKIGELMRAIYNVENETISYKALKLAPYIFLRPIELVSLQWNNINFDDKIIKIQAEKMKMRRTHIIPMAKQVVEMLQKMPKISNYVFPSFRLNTHITRESVNTCLRRLGFSNNEIVLHGFRAMASTILYENGFSSEIVEIQLAHVDKNKVRSAYNHAQYLNQRIEMLQWYADYLDKLRAKA